MEFNDGDESMCNMINQEGGMGLGPKYCKDCERKKLIKVMASAAGYYAGTSEEGEPFCRVSGYFSLRTQAQHYVSRISYEES